MDTVEVGGLRVAYERAGHGPPLVLLQGYVGDGPTTWRPQLDGLCDDFTVVAWDAPGAGRSSDPATAPTATPPTSATTTSTPVTSSQNLGGRDDAGADGGCAGAALATSRCC